MSTTVTEILKATPSQLFESFGVYQVLDDELTDEVTSDPVNVEGAKAITLFVEGATGVTGGVVKLETAVNSAGPYFVAGSVTVNAASGFAVSLSGGDDGLPARFARARIETVISGGDAPSVDAYIVVRK